MRPILVLVGAVTLAACATAPFTHRSQLILVSPQQEMQLGARAFKEVLTKSKVDTRSRLVGPVEEVGRRIARAAEQPDFQWQFAVVGDPKQQNAFCLPGGKVVVYTGIIPVAESTTGLAVVLGHEIAHAVARHGAERLSEQLTARAGGTLLSGLLGGGSGSTAVLQAYGLGAKLGVLLPFSRTQESEADHIGLILMAKAGYDPEGARVFWQRMEKIDHEHDPPQFLATHPNHGTREEQIAEWLPEARAYFDAAPRAADVKLPDLTR